MRLGDLDALREGLQWCIRQEEEPYTVGALVGIRMVLDETATISCAACSWRKPDSTFCRWMGKYFSDNFGCATFQRRQP